MNNKPKGSYSKKLLPTALEIPKHRFCALSSRRQHQFLAALAIETRKGAMDFALFKKRYAQLHSWTSLDRYHPPHWLSMDEALEEYHYFHSLFTESPPEMDLDMPDSMGGNPRLSWKPLHPVQIIIDQVRSPYNVGSLLRLIDNFGFTSLIHSTSWLRIEHPKLKRSARGCEHWIPVKYVENLTEFIDACEYPVIAVENDSQATPFYKWTPPKQLCFVLGNESYGIAEQIRKRCTRSIAIPLFGYKRSMNVHQAMAIIGARYVELHGKTI